MRLRSTIGIGFYLVLVLFTGFANAQLVEEEEASIWDTVCYVEDIYDCSEILEHEIAIMRDQFAPETAGIGCGSGCVWGMGQVNCADHTIVGIFPEDASVRHVLAHPIIDSPPNNPPGSDPGSGRTDWDNNIADLVICFSKRDCSIICVLKDGATDNTDLDNFECTTILTPDVPGSIREKIAVGEVCTGDKASGPEPLEPVEPVDTGIAP